MMRNITKSILTIFSMIFFCGTCGPDEDFYYGSPIEGMLRGRWKLDKVVTPAGTLEGFNIGYQELFVNSRSDVDNIDSVFRNDTLFARHVYTPHPGAEGHASKQTVTVTYRDGYKRFFKFYVKQYEGTERIEASDYVKEIGGPADTAVFYYSVKK